MRTAKASRVGRGLLLRRLSEITVEWEEALLPLILCDRPWQLHDLLRTIVQAPDFTAVNLLVAVRERREKEWAASARNGTNTWAQWLREKSGGGASLLHKWCKRAALPERMPCNVHGAPDATEEGLAVLKAEWAEVWSVHATAGALACTRLQVRWRHPTCLSCRPSAELSFKQSCRSSPKVKSRDWIVGTLRSGGCCLPRIWIDCWMLFVRVNIRCVGRSNSST
eukprot:746263-Amphidinium_carterae.1